MSNAAECNCRCCQTWRDLQESLRAECSDYKQAAIDAETRLINLTETLLHFAEEKGAIMAPQIRGIVEVASASGRQTPAFQIERSHEAVDAFWRVWMEVGKPHKHGVYESTWMAFKAAMKAGGKDERTDLAMSEMIEKASDAIRQTACPKCSQLGLIECEHISATDLAEKINVVDGKQEKKDG